MNNILQLKTFVLSFIFGVAFYLLSRFNYYIIKNKHWFWQFIFSLFFTIDSVLIYMYFNYRLNNGCYHIYFLTVIIIGYVVMMMYYKKIMIVCKKYVKKIKKSKNN